MRKANRKSELVCSLLDVASFNQVELKSQELELQRLFSQSSRRKFAPVKIPDSRPYYVNGLSPEENERLESILSREFESPEYAIIEALLDEK
jgi:hypothetical protein